MEKVTPRVEEYMESTRIIGSPKKSKKQKKVYPRLRLEHEYFPETAKQEVGKTYKIELEVKMTGLSIARFANDSEYEIHSYDIKNNNSQE